MLGLWYNAPMAIPVDHTVVSIVVPTDLRDRLHEIAVGRGTSVSHMLSAWLTSGIDAPIERDHKTHAVRSYKDELMLSLPRDWTRRSGIEKGDRVSVAYSANALIVRS